MCAGEQAILYAISDRGNRTSAGSLVQMPRRQYGAVPFRIRAGKLQVMLITSRETKRWIVPKGWRLRTPRQTARTEAYEESGV